MKRIVLIALTMLLAATPVLALVSQSFQIQGVLTNSEGAVLPADDYTVDFKIYDDPTAELLMWSDTVDGDHERLFHIMVLKHGLSICIRSSLWIFRHAI